MKFGFVLKLKTSAFSIKSRRDYPFFINGKLSLFFFEITFTALFTKDRPPGDIAIEEINFLFNSSNFSTVFLLI